MRRGPLACFAINLQIIPQSHSGISGLTSRMGRSQGRGLQRLRLCTSDKPTDRVSLSRGHQRLLPPIFQPTITKVEKILVGRAGIGKNNHVSDGEWLIPAPVDAVPRRRIRKLVHFFIGLQTGLPTEIAFVESIEPMTLDEFAARICDSTVQESQALPLQVATFIAQKIAQLPVGTCVGTDIVEKVGISSKHRELSIYRLVMRG